MTSNFEQSYNNLVTQVINTGRIRSTRAGPTTTLFGTMLTIDCMEKGLFPIITQRKVRYKGVLGELAAFLKGATDLATFKSFGCNYWDANAASWPPNKGIAPNNQMLGRIYGVQWRSWAGADGASVDQLAQLIEGITADPDSRRHLLTSFNPGETHLQCLPPCHVLAQFNAREDYLDCIVMMRSVDLCLGLPADIILYAALLIVICRQTYLRPGKLIFMMGDTHVYMNHIDKFQMQCLRVGLPLPTWSIEMRATIDNFTPDSLVLYNYNFKPHIDYTLNVGDMK